MEAAVSSTHPLGKDKTIPFRRESLTPALREAAVARVTERGALKTGGHFIHHEATPQEFHSSTWFYFGALTRDPSDMSIVIPGLVHKLTSDVIDQIEVVMGVATGGAVVAREVAQYIQSDRLLEQEMPSCLTLRHSNLLEEDGYDITNDDREWLRQWRANHKGRSPRCLLLDDVMYSSDTTLYCVEVLRGMGLPVTAILHVAATTDMMRPKLLEGIPSGSLFSFEAGKIYKPGGCPMCAQRIPRTVI